MLFVVLAAIDVLAPSPLLWTVKRSGSALAFEESCPLTRIPRVSAEFVDSPWRQVELVFVVPGAVALLVPSLLLWTVKPFGSDLASEESFQLRIHGLQGFSADFVKSPSLAFLVCRTGPYDFVQLPLFASVVHSDFVGSS